MSSIIDQKNNAKKILSEYIDKHCIFRCNPEIQYAPNLQKGVIPSKGASDTKYSFYLRRLTHNPMMLNGACALILDDIIEKFKESGKDLFFQFCGLETSSIPFLIGLQMTALKFGLSINSFSIRKERKPYGIFNLVDGIPTEAPVIIVDDLINSGSSIFKCLEVCEYELNLKILPDCYSIVTLTQPPFMFKHKETTYNINSIFVKNDFNFDYCPEKYWLPEDCNKSINKRTDYF